MHNKTCSYWKQAQSLWHYIAGIAFNRMTALSTEAGTLTKIRENAADVVRVASKNFENTLERAEEV